jgi:shikimate kinase/3-dehydroquinate synthase
MDVILVGLPGSGKSAIGRRLAARHGATFIDLDEVIERDAGRRIPEIFADDGEVGFRARERAAISALGEPDGTPDVRRVIASGGGAVVDPRNRWTLYRGRVVVWLDVRPEVLAQRLRRSPNPRPLLAGKDAYRTIRELAEARARFYGAAQRVAGQAEVAAVVDEVEEAIERAAGSKGADAGSFSSAPAILLRAATPIGEVVLGTGIAEGEMDRLLRASGARRAILLSEPGAWAAAGREIGARLAARGWPVEAIQLPQGEAAKSLAVVEDAARKLAALHAERGEPLVAIGGGALGDTAGFVAATYLRGVPIIHLPTTFVAQVDSSIGGKTAVDLPEGKNLVGAFHQPMAVVIDIRFLGTLPERHRRGALAEVVKMAALGDERLFAVLEREGTAIARGDETAFVSGAVAEVVERAAWAKVEIVAADEREAGRRISLNLGHSIGHAIEAAAGFGGLLHGEAIAYGLRAAARLGTELSVTPPDRAARIERLLDRLDLGRTPLPYSIASVLGHLETDKKHAAGRLRWVLPTGDGWTVRADVPGELVERVTSAVLSGLPMAGSAG